MCDLPSSASETRPLTSISHSNYSHVETRFCTHFIPTPFMSETSGGPTDLSPRLSKTCDQCKARKVRCICRCYFVVTQFPLLVTLALVESRESSCKSCLVRVDYFLCHVNNLNRSNPFRNAKHTANSAIQGVC